MVFRGFLIALALTWSLALADRCFAQTGAPPADAALAADRAKSNALTPELRDQARKLFEMAFGLLQSGDVPAAKLGFERGLAVDPANVIANFYMAETLVRLGENARARSFYSKVIAFDPDSAEALKAQTELSSLPDLDTQVAAPGPGTTPSPRGGEGTVKSTSVGGNGGMPFDDAGDNPNRLPITGIKIVVNLNPADHRQRVIGALQLEWGGTDGPMHGGRGPLAQPASPVQLAPGEMIRKVAINSMTFNFPANPPPVWVTGVRITTNKTSYTFGNMSFGPSTECVVPEGRVLVGFFGRSGSYIDQLGCVIGDANGSPSAAGTR
jgi:hypothetical protein